MYVKRNESVHVCFARDKEADGKRHIDGRPAQGEKLLGDPVAAQSPPAMVQATGVRLSPAIDREEQTTNRVRQLRQKQSYLPVLDAMRRNLGSKLRLSLKPTVLFVQFRHP